MNLCTTTDKGPEAVVEPHPHRGRQLPTPGILRTLKDLYIVGLDLGLPAPEFRFCLPSTEICFGDRTREGGKGVTVGPQLTCYFSFKGMGQILLQRIGANFNVKH